jgi:hopanoid biosynthesis associated protein HpnK
VPSLIITGDDFGLAEPVNEAIEIAHREGILTAASLLVSGEAVEDAVQRARRLPRLRVGLHLALVEEHPLLEANTIPLLVGPDGRLPDRLVAAGFRFFFRPGIRQQLEAEMRAQFAAFARTGLVLDHVDAHNHMHLHPTILRMLLRVGGDYGLRAVRLPYEPPVRSWRAARRGLGARLLAAAGLFPWMRLLRAQVRRAGLITNDVVFGMWDTGALDEALLLRLIEAVPQRGITEMYFHVATRRCPEIDRTMADYGHLSEFAALISPRVRAAVQRAGARLTTYSDLLADTAGRER